MSDQPAAPHRPDLTLAGGLLLLAVAAIAAGVGARAWLGLNDREPLLAGLPAGGAHQREVPPPRQVRRLVLIIADGVTVEAGLSLDPIRQLAARGILGRAEAAGPTISRAAYVAWLAGLDPVDSGVRTNRYRGSFPLDSLLSRARAGGLRSLAYDEAEVKLGELFGPHLSLHLAGPESWSRALEELQQADLSVLALTAADRAGHWHGARSRQYREAVAGLGRRLIEVMGRLDLDRDLLVVVSDHGHLPGGGHGGTELEVRQIFLAGAGAGLGRGRKGQLDRKDLAPSLAHLLGLLSPAHNRGWSLGWALDPALEPYFYQAAFGTQYPSRYRVERYLAAELGAELPSGRATAGSADLVRASLGNLPEARRLGWHMLEGLQQRVDRGRLDRLRDLRLRRAVWTGLPLILALGLLLAGSRLGWLRIGFSGWLLGLLPLAVMVAVLYLLEVRPTLSVGGGRLTWLLPVLAAGGGGAALHLVLVFLLPASGPGRRGAVLGRLAAGAWLVAALALTGFTLVPTAAGSALPDLRLLAGSAVLWACWIGYCLLIGLVLTLLGLWRGAPGSRPFPTAS